MEFKVFDLGLVEFKEAYAFQRETFNQVKNNLFSGALILCRHYPIITLGRQASIANILSNKKELQVRGIGLCQIERGGDVTYHGPGQLIAYPVLNLNYLKKDIHWFLRKLEDTVISLLSGFGIEARRLDKLTGVWIAKEKISSIGIAIKNWISFHGLSINIKKEDLHNFSFIRPCGMDIKITALEKVLGREIAMGSVKEVLVDKFYQSFNREV